MFRISRAASGSSHLLPFFPFLLKTDHINYSHPAGRSCAPITGIPFFSIPPLPEPSENPGKFFRILRVSSFVPLPFRGGSRPRARRPSLTHLPEGPVESRAFGKALRSFLPHPGCQACVGRGFFLLLPYPCRKGGGERLLYPYRGPGGSCGKYAADSRSFADSLLFGLLCVVLFSTGFPQL